MHETKVIDANAKLLGEENWIMFADLSIMDLEQGLGSRTRKPSCANVMRDRTYLSLFV
jgi:hypothetical protein